MKLVKVLLVSVFALAICKPAGAMDFDVKNIKGFGSLDMFTVANADDRHENLLKSHKANGNIGSYSLNSDAALGFRVGALYPIEDIADVGLSWGYVSGPNGERKVDGVKDLEYSRRFYRFLVEGRKDFKYNDKIAFLGGAGLGVAYGRQAITEPRASYNSNGALTHPVADKYFSGLAWELTAGAVYKATDKMNVEAGLKYAGFPSCPNDPPTLTPGSANYSEGEMTGMNWSTLGFFVGVRF